MQFTDPTSDPLASLGTAEALADGVSALLRVARGLTEGHRQIDLTGLDTMVGYLCARVLDLPPEQGRALRPRLMLLQAELDGLTGALAPP